MPVSSLLAEHVVQLERPWSAKVPTASDRRRTRPRPAALLLAFAGIVLATFHVLGLAACSARQSPPVAEPSELPPTVASTPPASGPSSVLEGAALILDVRTPEEYAAGHLEGALHIPVSELASRLGEVDAALSGARNEKIVTYCKSGKRAEQARLVLEQNGFGNVVNGGGYAQLK